MFPLACFTMYPLFGHCKFLKNFQIIKLLYTPSLCLLCFLILNALYMLVTQSCPSLCDPMNYSLPRSSVHGLLQARILEWIAIPFSRGSSQKRDLIWVSHIASKFFTVWVTKALKCLDFAHIVEGRYKSPKSCVLNRLYWASIVPYSKNWNILLCHFHYVYKHF